MFPFFLKYLANAEYIISSGLVALKFTLITLDNKFQKKFCICDEYVINLFVCISEVRKGT